VGGRVIEHAALVRALRERLPAGGPAQQPAFDGHRPAAVAVLLVDRGGATHVPFTLRSEALAKHSGQISLPGGARDAGDASFAACALREAREELGIDTGGAAVLGELHDVPTPTGFTIRPVVAELPPDAAVYRPDPGEVALVFEAPLGAFADPSIREDLGEREFRGIRYRMHAYHVGGHTIWGATARMIEQLVGLL
jgi:8-oxo-dGTP pyrophosphatase MutT (NUDIX family)